MHFPKQNHLVICALALLLPACDTSDPDPTIVITGEVVLATTGEPIPGLGVVLRETGGFGSAIFIGARTETAADGTFRLELAEPEIDAYTFRINDDPYDGCFSSWSQPVRFGDRLDLGVVELEDRPEGQICNR
jgi:hypothetical protein